MAANSKSTQKPAGPVIRVVDVGKTFREGTSRTDALKDVSFDIMPGEFCTIIGRSGSGKSTLLNMLAGLDHPTRGQIIILGRHIERMSEDELVNFRLRHVGFVFQSYNLFPSYDALENVAMPLTYRGVPKQVRNRRARKMIQAVGLVHRMHHTPNKMSGGEQQRIGIARALVSNPQIIFADEPTGNLDVKTSARALKLMTDCVRERGTTLIVVTHDPEMSRYADRVIRLLDGRVLENSVNPNPDPIVPPEDSGQDWANEDKPAKPKPQKKQHHSLFGRHKHAEAEPAVQAEAETQPKPEPPKEEPAVQVEAETQPKPEPPKEEPAVQVEAETQPKPEPPKEEASVQVEAGTSPEQQPEPEAPQGEAAVQADTKTQTDNQTQPSEYAAAEPETSDKSDAEHGGN